MNIISKNIIKNLTEGVNWDYYNKFDDLNNEYLPDKGEGDTLATQAVTAVNKLVYKWYNDGDVYDSSRMEPGANDLSSYANWLAKYIDGAKPILDRVFNSSSNDKYEEILKDVTDLVLDKEYLKELNKQPKEGSIYDCDGDYEFVDYTDDSEDDYYGEDEEW